MNPLQIIEADSEAAISGYLLKWNSFMDMDIAPVLEDEESVAVVKAAYGL